MIVKGQANLLHADVEALINTVNCVGVMGKGIALQFKQAYPENFKFYEQACKAKEVKVGQMLTFATKQFVNPKYIINFPTKDHWKGKSKIEYIERGLQDLVQVIKEFNISSIAVPPLGCGNGGLNWATVKPLIELAFAQFPELQVQLFEPQETPKANTMPVAVKSVGLTKARALLIRLIELYRSQDYLLSKLEIQKLAYFLQEAGEPLKLNYVKDRYGPYAENLNHLLQRLEGSYIRGYGDRSVTSEIYLVPGVAKEASEFLGTSEGDLFNLQRVSRLIDGFETPYGLELLATVHWVAKENNQAANDFSQALRAVHAWSDRKKNTFKPEHIQKAWERLQAEKWFESDIQPVSAIQKAGDNKEVSSGFLFDLL